MKYAASLKVRSINGMNEILVKRKGRRKRIGIKTAAKRGRLKKSTPITKKKLQLIKRKIKY